MKIYVKETKDFSTQSVARIINESILVRSLESIEEVCSTDFIFVSRNDDVPIKDANKYHIVMFEPFFENLSLRINHIYECRQNYYYLKNALESAYNPDITTLIAGSSYGTFGIDLSYIDNAVNISSISQDLYYTKELIFRAYECNKNIKNVVLCFSYYIFYCDLSLTQSLGEIQRVSNVYYPLLHDAHNCFILPSKEDFCIQSDIVNFEFLLESYATHQYKKGQFGESNPRTNYALRIWQDKSKNWCDLSDDEKEIVGKIRAESHNDMIKYVASYNENKDIFQEIVKFCNTNNINLVFAVTPATNCYLKYLDLGFKKDFYSAIDSVDGVVHLIDLSDDDYFDDNLDFIDTDHLNDSGAAKLTMVIDSVLHDINE